MTTESGLERLDQELAARAAQSAGLPARARIAALAGDDFLELGALSRSQLRDAAPETYGDGLVAGFATVGGRMALLLADDPTVLPKTDGAVAENKRMRALGQADHGELPVIYLADDGGGEQAPFDPANARLLGSYSDRTTVAPSLRYVERAAPHVAVILGQCSGRNALFAARADVVIGTPHPRRSAAATEAGPVVDLEVADEATALAAAARVLTLVPDLREPLSPVDDLVASGPGATLEDGIDPNALGAARLVAGLVDAGALIFSEAPDASFATGLGTLAGFPIAYAAAGLGIGGAATLSEADLAQLRRVASLASQYRIPLLMLQHDAAYDAASLAEPGYVQSLSALIAELHDGSMPLLSVVTSRGHALDDFVLGGRELGTHYVVAWPEAKVGLDPVGQFTRTVADSVSSVGPWDAAGHGLIDDVVKPSETRDHLARIIGLLARGRAIPFDAGTETDRRFLPR